MPPLPIYVYPWAYLLLRVVLEHLRQETEQPRHRKHGGGVTQLIPAIQEELCIGDLTALGKLFGQLHELLLEGKPVTDALGQAAGKLRQFSPCLRRELIPRLGLVFIEMQHLHPENLVGHL